MSQAAETTKDGVLKKPDVEAIFGLHVDPWIPVGKVGLRDGAMMAQADDFDLTVFGKSGHGARPHLGHDAVYIATQIVNALQSVVSRSTDPRRKFIGGLPMKPPTNCAAGRS